MCNAYTHVHTYHVYRSSITKHNSPAECQDLDQDVELLQHSRPQPLANEISKTEKLKILKKINRSTATSQRKSLKNRKKKEFHIKILWNPKKDEEEEVLYSPIMAAVLSQSSSRDTACDKPSSHPHPFTAKPPHRPRPPLCPTIIATPSSVASRIPRDCHLTLDALLSSGVAASATFKKTSRCCSRSARCTTQHRDTSNQTTLQTPLTLAVYGCRTL